MKNLLIKSPGKFIAICMISLSSVVAFNGCSDDEDEPTTTGPAANEVWMQGSKFSPATRTVAVNTTVKWTNKDGMDHNVISDSALFDSGIIAAGATFSRTFTTVGTYPYTCTLHANMTGTIIVQ
jgi:plastocyanin